MKYIQKIKIILLLIITIPGILFASETPDLSKENADGSYIVRAPLGNENAYGFGITISADTANIFRLLSGDEIRNLEDLKNAIDEERIFYFEPVSVDYGEKGNAPCITFTKIDEPLNLDVDYCMFLFSGGLLLERISRMEQNIIDQQVATLGRLK